MVMPSHPQIELSSPILKFRASSNKRIDAIKSSKANTQTQVLVNFHSEHLLAEFTAVRVSLFMLIWLPSFNSLTTVLKKTAKSMIIFKTQ